MRIAHTTDLDRRLSGEERRRFSALKAEIAERSKWEERARIYEEYIKLCNLTFLQPPHEPAKRFHWTKEVSKMIGDSGSDDRAVLQVKFGCLAMIKGICEIIGVC